MRYWIEYTDGSRKEFEASTKVEALHYFMMEGDHAFNYGKQLLGSSAAEQAPHTGQRGGSNPPLATNKGTE
jgi:hypothetical protein